MQETEIITEKKNWSKCREQLIVELPNPMNTFATQFLRFKEHCRRGDERTLRAKSPASLL